MGVDWIIGGVVSCDSVLKCANRVVLWCEMLKTCGVVISFDRWEVEGSFFKDGKSCKRGDLLVTVLWSKECILVNSSEIVGE